MITMYFGSPGCGKTTTATRLLYKNRKRYSRTLANFSCKACDVDNVDLHELGIWTFPENSLVCIDESGIEYNSRSFKTFPKSAIRWFKKHRHYAVDVAFFSQSWEDTDKIIRDLATSLVYVMKLGPFTVLRRVHKRVTVDRNTEQIIDGYRMTNFLWLVLYPLKPLLRFVIPPLGDVTIFFRPLYYKYFDTFEREPLPVKYDDTPRRDIPPLLSLSSIQGIRAVAKMKFSHRSRPVKDTDPTGGKDPHTAV